MGRRQRLVRWLALTALLFSLLLSGAIGDADAQGTVVASGLVYPRFLTVADDGTVYVSEAGSGGEETVPPVPDAPGGPLAVPLSRGNTDAVGEVGGARIGGVAVCS